jgi:hypothetical protein
MFTFGKLCHKYDPKRAGDGYLGRMCECFSLLLGDIPPWLNLHVDQSLRYLCEYINISTVDSRDPSVEREI